MLVPSIFCPLLPCFDCFILLNQSWWPPNNQHTEFINPDATKKLK